MTSGQLRSRSTADRIMGVHPLMLVGVGGAVGSLARYGATSTQPDPSVAVFVLNVIGSLALGSITAWLQHSGSPLHGAEGEARNHWAALLGLGLCGGLTTFSTHIVDVAQRLDSSSWGPALFSLLATATVTIAAAGMGYEATRRAVRSLHGGAP